MTRPLTYAIGDVHGSFEKLEALVERCKAHAGARASRLVFLGDYIDRGPRSRDVVGFLMTLQARRPTEVVCLKGNHEDMLGMARGSDPRIAAWWIANGGGATLGSYGAERAADLPDEHLCWLASLPLTHDDGRRLFVHAGIDPARALDAQSEHELMWIREPFLSYEGRLDRFVVHGHTPLASGRPDLRPNRLNLDTGAVFGGPLSAAAFEAERSQPVDFLFAP